MRYIIISIIFLILISFSFNIASAQEDWLTKAKQLVNTMKQKNIEKKAEQTLEETQEKIEEKVKQEVKKGIKNWFRNRKAWLERKMNPLKNRIQEGSDAIREWVGGLKDYFQND